MVTKKVAERRHRSESHGLRTMKLIFSKVIAFFVDFN